MPTDRSMPPAEPGRYLPVLLLLFVGSGCAAMIYEVVWLQLLQLVIGSTAAALGVLLGTFMGGMGLGGLLLPRLVSARRHPLRVYALLELGIGAIGLAVLVGMPRVEAVYVAAVGHGWAGTLLRAGLAGACLLPPTLLMGATLPAIARWTDSSPGGVAWLGLCYGGNIAGAVVGCLLAGFYLLRVFDMATATGVAVAVNVVVAAVALGLAAASGRHEAPAGPATEPARAPGAGAVYGAIALSGMAALGAEVVWTRLLSLLLGPTVYTFALILAVFLVGLGIGSTLGAAVGRRARSPQAALGLCQGLAALGVAWTALMIAGSLPFWPVVPTLATSPWYTLQLDLARCLWAVLPPTLCWGASFPLALAAVARRGQDPGRLVGGVAAANTAGAIAGALAFSLVLIPAIGTAHAQRALIGLAALGAVVALAPLVGPRRGAGRLGGALGVVALLGGAGALAWGVGPVPWAVVAYGRQAPLMLARSITPVVAAAPTGPDAPEVSCVYVGEGRNVAVAVTENRQGVRNFHGAGKIQASTLPTDMRLQRLLGHLPPLLHKKPETVLVVACGAGVTAGCFVLHPDVKRIVICDIEPLVPTTVTPMFGEANYHVVDGIARRNPTTVNGKQVEVVYDDGRHFLRTTRETFDIITSDPVDPWIKGCAALSTLEYYRMARDHLNPGGSMSLWFPIAETDLPTARSLIATFFRAFPHGILWTNEHDGAGYDAILSAQDGPTVVDLDALGARLRRPDHAAVRQSLRDVGLWTPVGFEGDEEPNEGIELLAHYAGQASGLAGWGKDAQINTDGNLRLQFLAGMALNTANGDAILASILEHYRFPTATFVGTPARLADLKQALQLKGRPDR